MQEILLIIYLVVAILLIGIILVQQGKGAVMGASFGAGGANTVFGSAGAGNVLTKTTTILAILFFSTALAISYFNSLPTDETDAVLDAAPTAEAAKPLPQEGAADKANASAVDALEGEEAPGTDSQLEGEQAPTDVKAKADAAAEKLEKAGKEASQAVAAKQAEEKKTENKKEDDSKGQ